MNNFEFKKGSDCSSLFRDAYHNRYTWDTNFKGYKGECILKDQEKIYECSFLVDHDCKAKVEGIDNEEIQNEISSQLWEVAIHRVRRSFEKVHGGNTFTAGDFNDFGLEILVGGNNVGDKYRVKDKIITMVYRHIHGSLVNIFTTEVFETGNGYLSKAYTSQYFEPKSISPKSGVCSFVDKFISLGETGPWVLSEREMKRESFKDINSFYKKFSFENLKSM